MEAPGGKAVAEKKEASAAISSVRGMLGLGTDDPPESSWLNMTSTDFKTGDRIPMGKVGSTQEKDATYLG